MAIYNVDCHATLAMTYWCNTVPEPVEGPWTLDNRSRRNNGTLTNNDDTVGTIE